MTNPKPTCPNCAYELSGIVKDDITICPECGKPCDPSTRKAQSLRYALNFAVGLIGIPSVVIPILALVTIHLLEYRVVMQYARLYHQAAFTAPLIWLPIAFWITIRYKHTPDARRDIGATIAILLAVTFASAIVYYALFVFTALLTSGF